MKHFPVLFPFSVRLWTFFHVGYGRGNSRRFPYLMVLLAMLIIPMGQGMAADAGKIGDKCADEGYRAFDFWLGDWDVYADGQLAGHNSIRRILAGCAISESWESVNGGHGNSYNAYDARTGNWNQFWVDTNGLVLRLVGKLEDGAMTMLGLMPIEDEPDVVMRHRIRWTPLKNGHVRQEWESSRSDVGEWKALFSGIYVPAGSPPPDTEAAAKTAADQ